MPKNRKEAKNCHDCGLEALDECESGFGHIPSDEAQLPCSVCLRNPKKKVGHFREDFHSEQWTVESNGTAIFEDPTPHEMELLKSLRLIATEVQAKSSVDFHGTWEA